MSYSKAKDYAEIYNAQESIEAVQDQTVRDVVLTMAPIMNLQEKDAEPRREDAIAIKQHMESFKVNCSFSMPWSALWIGSTRSFWQRTSRDFPHAVLAASARLACF